MWAGNNQASRLIGRKTDKLWSRKREVVPCMIMYSFIPHSDNVHSMLGLIHSSQSTGGLFTLFVKKPLCFSKPVKVLICALTGLFRRWLLLGLWRCVRHVFEPVSYLCMYALLVHNLPCVEILQWGLFWSLSSLVWLGSAAAAYWTAVSFDLLPSSTNLGPSHLFRW